MNEVSLYGRRRRGMTLLETMLVISAGAIILSTMLVALHAMYRSHALARNENMAARTVVQFSARFRADAHAARQTTMAVDSQQNAERFEFRISSGDWIRYVVGEQGIERTRESVGNLQHRELFRLPEGSRVTWDNEVDGAPGIAAVVVSYPVGSEDESLAGQRKIRIEAAVGLDAQHAAESAP